MPARRRRPLHSLNGYHEELDISPGDWVGTTDQLLERIRPRRARYEQAIVLAALALALGLFLAAKQLKPEMVRYDFIKMGDALVIVDRRAGSVALCQPAPEAIVCTQEDSANAASLRRLEAEWSAQPEQDNP